MTASSGLILQLGCWQSKGETASHSFIQSCGLRMGKASSVMVCARPTLSSLSRSPGPLAVLGNRMLPVLLYWNRPERGADINKLQYWL